MNRLGGPAVAGVLITGLAAAGVATANLTTVPDPVGDQTSGGKARDLVEGTAGHAGRKLVHTASFDAPNANTPPDLIIRSRGRRYKVTAFHDAAQVIRVRTGRVTGRARLTKLDDNTWRFAFRRRAIGRPKLGYGWALVMPAQKKGDPRADRLPDTGFTRHRLG